MENLISDCLPPIFSHLQLSDLLSLRTVSRHFKQEVEDYLPNVRSLSLYLTTPRTPEVIALYENICRAYENVTKHDTSSLSSGLCLRKLKFGISGLTKYEDGTILQNQNYFRLSDFLIVNSFSELSSCLKFVKKNCSKIDKLALVIDHCDHYLPEVRTILAAFPGIKVLLLESTLQDSCRHYDSYTAFYADVYRTLEELEAARVGRYNEDKLAHGIRCMSMREKNWVKLPPDVYDSILGLNHLEKLYLFSKRQSQLKRPGIQQSNFLSSVFGRLKVLHINSDNLFWLPVDDGPEGTLEELAFNSDIRFKTFEHLMFSKLKKFILSGLSPYGRYSDDPLLTRPSLEILDFSIIDFVICPISIKNLLPFTDLESFHCRSISVRCQLEREPKRAKNCNSDCNCDLEIVPENLKNWTIKHLQVIRGSKSAEERNHEARRWSKYFVKLETCTFLEPEYSVVRINDLQE